MDSETSIWEEIQDAPGEIFDILNDLKDEFDLDAYLASDYDY